MSRQYTNSCEFDVEAGSAVCVELPAPPRGLLNRLVIKQTTGVLSGLTCEVLDRKDACTSVDEVSNSFDPDADFQRNPLLDVELHRIVADITVAGGSALYEGFNLDAGYENRDEYDIRRTPNTRIYLDLTVAGTGTKRIQVAYTIAPMTNA